MYYDKQVTEHLFGNSLQRYVKKQEYNHGKYEK